MAMTSLFCGEKLKLVTMFPVREETWKQVFLEPSAPSSRFLFKTRLSMCAASSPVASSQAFHKTPVMWEVCFHKQYREQYEMLLDIRAALLVHV